MNDLSLKGLLEATRADAKNQAEARILARIAEHDGELNEETETYLSGLRDAIRLVQSADK